jgi:hypothetical protein
MEFLVTVLGLVLAIWGLAWAARRHLCLFTVTVDDGRITKLGGRIPPRLLADLRDVVARNKPKRLRIVCRIEQGRAVLDFNLGADAGLQQIVRNVVGEYPAIRLKHAPRVRGL